MIPNSLDSPSPQELLLALTRFVPHEVCNPLMSAITSAVYGYMLEQSRLLTKLTVKKSAVFASRVNQMKSVSGLEVVRYMAMKSEKPSVPTTRRKFHRSFKFLT